MTTYSRFQQGMIRVLGCALLVMGGALVGVGCELARTCREGWQESGPGGRGGEEQVNSLRSSSQAGHLPRP
jgi:hypothetical protein